MTQMERKQKTYVVKYNIENTVSYLEMECRENSPVEHSVWLIYNVYNSRVLLDLLVFPDPLVQLVVDMTHLEAMMSTELTRPLSGPRIMRWMPPSSP